MRFFLLAAFFAFFAGQALARLNITIDGLGVIPASQFLSVNDPVRNDCSNDCDPANAAIQGCGDDNDSCLCRNDTVSAILNCQECMFTQLIHLNRRPEDPRAGQATALTAYSTACNNSLGSPLATSQITLTVPSDWDGPFGQGLNTFGTVVSVAAAAILGSGLIAVVNTM
ncbi:hypothetical protein BD414DRAFT_525275 [Trametes punicea]|nr:hypothetical protein BD414DRAFT_525275 [Trametes punicea]